MKDDEISLDNFIVAFVDVLGTKDAFLKYPAITSRMSEEDVNEMKRLVGRPLFNLFDFHDAVKTMLTTNYYHPDAHRLPPEVLKEYLYNIQNDIRSQNFSDGFVLYMPIDSNHHNPLAAFWSLIYFTGGIMLYSLAKGSPVRGGIEIGWGTLRDNQLFGGAIASAYTLESGIAKYPRIVLGKHLLEYLNSYRNTSYGDRRDEMTKGLLAMIDQLHKPDIDGVEIVHWLANRYKDLFRDEPNGVSVVFSDVKKFVDREYERFMDTGNAKLGQRYFLLSTYIDEYEESWLKT